MLIDSNAYIGHWPFSQRTNNTCESLLQMMDQYGVHKACVSNLNGIFYKNTQAANEELNSEIKSQDKFRDRFLPFGVINPIFSGWKHDLEVCRVKMQANGVRLYPQYHGYDLTHPACIELVKTARDLGLVVALSLRMVDSRPSSWLDLEIGMEWKLQDVLPIIREVPDARYLILNAANSLQLNEEETTILKSTDIVIDTSGRAITDLGALLKVYGKEKFSYGSHSPMLDNLTGLLRVESLRETEADEDTKTLLRSGNIRRLLKV